MENFIVNTIEEAISIKAKILKTELISQGEGIKRELAEKECYYEVTFWLEVIKLYLKLENGKEVCIKHVKKTNQHTKQIIVSYYHSCLESRNGIIIDTLLETLKD